MNIPESDSLKKFMVLSYAIDNPEECIKKLIEDDAKFYLENIVSHYSLFFDQNKIDIFEDLGGFKIMISESVFDTKEEILNAVNLDQSVYDDLMEYTSDNMIQNKDDTADYLIKNYRTGAIYSVIQLENTFDEIYNSIRDDKDRFKKVLASLGYIKEHISEDLSSYSYYFYSETEEIYLNISDKDMLKDRRFMFDYVYVEKMEYILSEYDQDIIERGIESLD